MMLRSLLSCLLGPCSLWLCLVPSSALDGQEGFFVRGDVTADGAVDIADPIDVLTYLFDGDAIPCDDAADANDDGAIDLADPVALLAYLFGGGAEPPFPFVACGLDPSSDGLGCAAMPTCPQPPCLLEYSDPAPTYTEGESIVPNVPSWECGAPTSFAVDPTLPTGLTLDPGTGVITGTPTVVTASQDYVITASSADGEAFRTLEITVQVAAPCDLEYSTPAPIYTAGIAIPPNTPTVGCGAPSGFETVPAGSLPDGLAIDPVTGVIGGTPTSASFQTAVTIRASNATGEATTQVFITVFPAAPCNLQYSEPNVTYVEGIPIAENVPSIGCGPSSPFPIDYAIDPPLPPGLSFSSVTGVISGTPMAPVPSTAHLVTASNVSGSTTSAVTIAVEVPIAPCSLSYGTPVAVYAWSSVIEPNVATIGCGPAAQVTVVPPLPAGLEIDPVTATITGVPLEIVPATLHTITVGNVSGQVSTAVSIEVVATTPSTLPGGAVYAGPALTTPRYSHAATPLDEGTIVVIGGTDELHLTAIDLCEVFVPGATPTPGLPIPGTGTGAFIDQDIDGNLITMQNGGRFFHTATRLDDGTILVVGGTTSIFFGIANEASELFDPATRTFTEPGLQIDPADDIDISRVRHTATMLPYGNVLIAGGQESTTVVIPGGPGGGLISQDAYPSTEVLEIYDPVTRSFSPAVDISGLPAEMTTSRGRAGHTSARWAGFDGQLGTGDDVLGQLGGYMTLSALSLAAPDTLFPWSPVTTKLSAMDFYDGATGTMNLAQGLVLTRRVNDPIAVNLGRDHPTTPFGDPGTANAVLILGGDNDETCPQGHPTVGAGTTDHAELIVATFTGFGPANGIVFTSIPGGAMVNDLVSPSVSSSTFANGHELAILGCGEFNRSRTQAVLLDMTRVYNAISTVSSVVVTAGGSDATVTPGGCAQQIDGFCNTEVRGFQFFDPFYDIANNGTLLSQLDPLNPAPWDFSGNGSTVNPLGLRGTWLHYDADIPSDGIVGYADNTPTISLATGRLMHTLTRSVGEDGVAGTLDDRVVVIGGTNAYLPLFGDDALGSCEVFVPPDGGP